MDGKSAFLDDFKSQDAVLRNLHTLSESVQRISEDLRAQHPEADWRAIIAFRNVVVHDYLGTDLNQIWNIVEHDLPDLKHTIATMLDELNDGNGG
ncbi:MAG: DUF86 domain-containing protein [Anaerolineales bacterium]|nr:DUF86 domain-containing protein [Anaerolineales bacterium]